MAEPPQFTRAYRVVLAVATPIMRWARLRVTGVDLLPRTGPVLLVADHDSYWDPIAIAVAARRTRQIHALSKSTLWRNKVVGAFMTDMGHIPVERGVNNDAALERAIEALRAGACIGIFPEATRSLGRPRRARSGIGRMAELVPEAQIVCVRTNGSTDVVRLPKRPLVTVEFYRPRGGGLAPGESAGDFAQRLVDELRERAPYEVPGRRRTATKFAA
ncbi:MAG: lysophospholipid acyltransferase family protein, partial [Jatrophihabitans sp.]|uniref:lysophospholipid acyltransferase family protein n=1 Tax=Jatrophihabitans sp. TaxID=1932789 RepID=UPI003F81B0C3